MEILNKKKVIEKIILKILGKELVQLFDRLFFQAEMF